MATIVRTQDTRFFRPGRVALSFDGVHGVRDAGACGREQSGIGGGNAMVAGMERGANGVLSSSPHGFVRSRATDCSQGRHESSIGLSTNRFASSKGLAGRRFLRNHPLVLGWDDVYDRRGCSGGLVGGSWRGGGFRFRCLLLGGVPRRGQTLPVVIPEVPAATAVRLLLPEDPPADSVALEDDPQRRRRQGIDPLGLLDPVRRDAGIAGQDHQRLPRVHARAARNGGPAVVPRCHRVELVIPPDVERPQVGKVASDESQPGVVDELLLAKGDREGLQGVAHVLVVAAAAARWLPFSSIVLPLLFLLEFLLGAQQRRLPPRERQEGREADRQGFPAPQGEEIHQEVVRPAPRGADPARVELHQVHQSLRGEDAPTPLGDLDVQRVQNRPRPDVVVPPAVQGPQVGAGRADVVDGEVGEAPAVLDGQALQLEPRALQDLPQPVICKGLDAGQIQGSDVLQDS
mmetsp:Transcript_14273/g.33227  ORF Transcript_14273/g.33227 Transcript_14273/m.33227 type:complete len:460 (-) Transcript_14273:1136-2515(-)